MQTAAEELTKTWPYATSRQRPWVRVVVLVTLGCALTCCSGSPDSDSPVSSADGGEVSTPPGSDASGSDASTSGSDATSGADVSTSDASTSGSDASTSPPDSGDAAPESAVEAAVADVVTSEAVAPVCGNDACEATESCSNCPSDCGACMTSHMYRIWHWNVAGHSIHKGSTSDGLIEIIANSIVANNADFATLNELCRNQYDELIDELRTRGWPSDDGNFARFATARAAGTNVCQDYAYGIALFSKLPLNSATTIDLVDGNALEHRKMLCAPLAARPHVRLCTTHVTTDSTYQPGQFQTILSKLDGYFAQDDSVILTGDLNVQPGSALLNPFYSAAVDTAVNGNNSGSLRELDDSDPAHCPGYGEQTFGTTGGACDVGRKLDYIFVPEERMNGAGEADSHAIPQCGSIDCSDHRMLEGSVKLYAP